MIQKSMRLKYEPRFPPVPLSRANVAHLRQSRPDSGLDSRVNMAHTRQSRPDSGLDFRANMAHIRQSRPDSGLGFRVKALKTSQVVPFSLGSGLVLILSPMKCFSSRSAKASYHTNSSTYSLY